MQDKLDQMVFVWSDIQALLEEREAKLLDVMDLAEKFWCDHCALIITIKDTQDLLKDLEEPGVDPSVVKQQQETLEVSLLLVFELLSGSSTCLVMTGLSVQASPQLNAEYVNARSERAF